MNETNIDDHDISEIVIGGPNRNGAQVMPPQIISQVKDERLKTEGMAYAADQ